MATEQGDGGGGGRSGGVGGVVVGVVLGVVGGRRACSVHHPFDWQHQVSDCCAQKLFAGGLTPSHGHQSLKEKKC